MVINVTLRIWNLFLKAESQIEAVKSVNEDQTATIRRKEEEVQKYVAELAEERENSANVQKKVKQLQYHLTEAEEQISEQKSLRARCEKHNEELTHEIKELLAEVDEASAAELAASSLRKKADQETNNLRREMAEAAKRADMAYNQLKKKHDEAVTEMGRQIESLIKAKSKWVTFIHWLFASELSFVYAGNAHVMLLLALQAL